MSTAIYLLAALFLPLFPLSMAFNQLAARTRQPLVRAVLLLIWPQLGIGLIALAALPPPAWFRVWALVTAALYAYRAIALRDVGLWIGFIATSAWSLVWLGGAVPAELALQALAFSAPLVLLSLLTGDLERHFGAAHTRLQLGLASVAPRYALALVMAILAAVATPVFPNFFTILATISSPVAGGDMGLSPLVIGSVVALVWLLWSWSGIRLLQGIVVGVGRERAVADMSRARARAYAIGYLILAGAGLELAGVLL
ncbi:MAG: hypothetical protein H6981_00170 [Gammaproteobacteria bacterium]|nr:hypothetical protein [Gammaproteobacteria bacterium]MCP5135206.1 hypothetical protein [Gammaproteobacteria bacterium]